MMTIFLNISTDTSFLGLRHLCNIMTFTNLLRTLWNVQQTVEICYGRRSIGILIKTQSIYRQTSNTIRASVGHKIVDRSDVDGASPDGTAPTISTFSN